MAAPPFCPSAAHGSCYGRRGGEGAAYLYGYGFHSRQSKNLKFLQ
jgi:hypothetical protein